MSSAYLTCAQVAEDVGVSAQTVLRWWTRASCRACGFPVAASESRNVHTWHGSTLDRRRAAG